VTHDDLMVRAGRGRHGDGAECAARASSWLTIARRGLVGLTIAALAGLAGCGGGGSSTPTQEEPPPTDNNPPPPTVDAALVAQANPEQCAVCHTGTTADAAIRDGAAHEADYEQYFQDGVIKIVTGSMAFSTNGVDTAMLTFQMTKNGQAFDCTQADVIGSYWAEYDPATKTFPSDQSLASAKSYDAATNTCTLMNSKVSADTIAKMAGNGIVQLYGVDDVLQTQGHMQLGKYPFAGVLKLGTVDYSTAANVSGCENCHTQPFLKHAYIYGKVTDNAGHETQFYTCKGCHYDERAGHDFNWQIEKDDPARAAELDAGASVTPEEMTKYAYKAKLMNDVHMSHAMEFAYPQSMFNCVTCHKGQLDAVLADNEFKAETCISCHSVDGIKAKMTATDALSAIHGSIVADDATLRATNCQVCHAASVGIGLTFKKIHGGGYDPKIYATDGTRYSDTFVVTIDSASIADDVVDVKFHATGTLGSLSATNITPTVMVGLYGYDTKDFIVAAHDRDADGNRLLEYKWGDTNPRFTDATAASGSWEVKVDLSMWKDMIDSGAIKRAEIAVLPELKKDDGTVLGLNAPSRTFDLAANAFDDSYFKDIVKVAVTTDPDTGKVSGCNTCHDQLATTFHSGIRGGNIRVCRICHEVSHGASHLEDQSRSIDSYVHSIHQFQAFDIGDIDFTNAVEGAEYQHQIDSNFPRFGIENCEACHNKGMYNVPDQSKSMAGVLSDTDAVAGRKIGGIPTSVTGPAVRACGACHRAQVINADDEGKLQALIQHWKTFGYYIESTDDTVRDLWAAVVEKIQGIFGS
jgi:OmcA/MtrC family decaheme c-type cytochrome